MMEGTYSNLVAHISKAMFSDDDDQSERLASLYLNANQAEKDILDNAFICLCGWSLKTLMERCEQEGVQDTMNPEWWSKP
jgi:hypothetical protein